MRRARHTARGARRWRGSAACLDPLIGIAAADLYRLPASADRAPESPARVAPNNDGSVGMDLTALQSVDAGDQHVTIVGTPTATTYCVTSTVGGYSFMKNGPAADIANGNCT